MAKRYKRNNYINPGAYITRSKKHTSDRVGDWFENQAGTIFKIEAYRYNYDGDRVFKLSRLGSSSKKFELNEFELKNQVDLMLLKKFNKWSYV